MIKVLAAIVAPPHLTVSGGAKAGEMLSAALASSCDMTVASMMGAPGELEGVNGAGEPTRVSVQSHLPRIFRAAPMLSRYRALFYRSSIPQIIQRGGYDLVHLHNPMPALEMAHIADVCVDAGIPYVVSTHGFNEVANGGAIYGFDPLRRAMWKRLVENPVSRVARHAAAVFALSPADFDIVRKMGFRGPIQLVPNGVATPPASDPKTDEAALARLGVPAAGIAGQKTFMFLANHTPNKGLPILFAAFAAMKQPYLLIVGGEKRDGVDYDGAMRACGAQQSIIVTGRLQNSDVAALFRRSDLFVFPTLADTFPLVVLEAMSHGLPVVASSVGGIPYQLSEECGVLTPPGDAGALATALEGLARNPDAMAAIGRNARVRVAREFTWESAAAQALAGYERVLSPRRARISPTAAIGPRLAQ